STAASSPARWRCRRESRLAAGSRGFPAANRRASTRVGADSRGKPPAGRTTQVDNFHSWNKISRVVFQGEDAMARWQARRADTEGKRFHARSHWQPRVHLHGNVSMVRRSGKLTWSRGETFPSRPAQSPYFAGKT